MHPDAEIVGFQWLHPPGVRQPLSPDWQRFVAAQTLPECDADDACAFAVGHRGLPDDVPSHLDPTLFEQMAWALLSRPHCDVIVFPLRVSLQGTGGATILACRREVLLPALAGGWLAICRPRAIGALRAALADGDGMPVGASDLTVEIRSRALLEETLVLLPSVLQRPPSPWHVAQERLRAHLPGAARVRLRGLVARARLLLDAVPRHRPEPPLALRSHWEPPFPRPRVGVRRAAGDGRIPVWVAMHWLELGGAEKFVVDLVRALPRDRFAVHVTTDLPSDNRWVSAIEGFVEEVLHLPEFLPHYMFGVFAEHFVRTRGLRLLHINHAPRIYESLFHLRRFGHPLRVLQTLHILELPPHSGGYPEWAMANFGVFIDHHHVVSEHLRRFLMERWLVPDERIDMIRIDVDTDWFDPARVPAGTVRRMCGIPRDAVVVGFIGRLAEQKRPLEFVRLARLLADQWRLEGREEPLHFVVAGDGPLRADVEEAVGAAGLTDVVHCIGELRDTRPVYRDCDVVAMPSANEGLALVTYEAMAMATPVFFTDVGAQAELLEPAQLVPQRAPVAPALADRVWPYLLDAERRRALGARQRAHVVERHSHRHAMARMVALYERLVAEARGEPHPGADVEPGRRVAAPHGAPVRERSGAHGR